MKKTKQQIKELNIKVLFIVAIILLFSCIISSISYSDTLLLNITKNNTFQLNYTRYPFGIGVPNNLTNSSYDLIASTEYISNAVGVCSLSPAGYVNTTANFNVTFSTPVFISKVSVAHTQSESECGNWSIYINNALFYQSPKYVYTDYPLGSYQYYNTSINQMVSNFAYICNRPATVDSKCFQALGATAGTQSAIHMNMFNLVQDSTYLASLNNFPNITVEYNKTLCYDTTGNVNQYNYFKNTVSDTENDIIYTAQQTKVFFSNKSFYIQDFLLWENDIFGNQICNANYDFFTSSNFISNYSYNTEGLFSNPNKVNYEFRIFDDNTAGYVCRKNLIWYEGIDIWRFKTDYALTTGTSTYLTYSIPKNDTLFTNIYYDSAFNIMSNITVNYTNDGNLTIFINGNYVYSTNYTLDNDFTLRLDLNKSYGKIEFYLIGNNINLYENNYSATITNLNYIDFIVPNHVSGGFVTANTKFVRVKQILYYGIGEGFFPVFTLGTGSISSVGFNKTGNYYFTFYITDDVHLSANQYKEVLIQFTVTDCNSFTSPDTLTKTSYGSVSAAFQTIGDVELKICKTLDLSPIYIGLSWCTIFFFCSLFVQLVLTFFLHLLHKEIDFSLIIFVIFGFFIQFLIYTPLLWKIIESFIFVGAVVTIFFRWLSGGKLIGNNNTGGNTDGQ